MIKTNASGSKIQISINASFVTIPGVEGIPEFGAMKAVYENTAIDDTAKTYNADLPDFGQIALKGSWDSKTAVHAYMLAASLVEGAAELFKVTFKSGAIATFSALILSFKTDGNKGKDEGFSSDIKITGAVAITPAP